MSYGSALKEASQQVLLRNRHGNWTSPDPNLYPHQWLWDSGFIAIGLATFDPQAAADELLSVMRGQWQNGMLPHIIFGESKDYWEGPEFWQSERALQAPHGVQTSAVTQPPVLAIAAQVVAQHMRGKQRSQFLNRIYPPLLRYHEWLYRERDPAGTGLIVLVHPWESGMDNTPPWMALFQSIPASLEVRILDQLKLSGLLTTLRGDVKKIPLAERQTNIESIQAVRLAQQYRRQRYDWQQIIPSTKVAVESLDFNCILVRANQSLRWIAGAIDQPLPAKLLQAAKRAAQAIESLWDERGQEYFSRDFKSAKLINEPSVATFMPLYAKTTSQARAKILVAKLHDKQSYAAKYPVPSAPLDSAYFSDRRYWQGPVWINMNWFIIQGLKNYGYNDEAWRLTESCLQLVRRSGFREYYSPLDGAGYGGHDFSWTAALILNLMESEPQLKRLTHTAH